MNVITSTSTAVNPPTSTCPSTTPLSARIALTMLRAASEVTSALVVALISTMWLPTVLDISWRAGCGMLFGSPVYSRSYS